MTTVPAPAPDAAQLAAHLGLTPEEYDRIVTTLGRQPSTAELGAYSVMWSEHCSYKSSRVHLGRLPSDGPRVLVGPGENAGVVDVGDGYAVAFKIESHNHPSFVEPYQGAATGVGGIIRDVLTMGARPIALLDSLRFGEVTGPDADPVSRRIVDGVVRGVGAYGNAIGVATVGGETAFDPVYAANPLVNVACVGVMPADRLQLARAEAVGDVAVLIGQRTGRDGIGGASVLASAELGDADEAKRPNVQIADPFAGKLLIEACLDLYDAGLLSGIQDMGAAGIACSTAEVAAKAGMGMRVDLDRVPLREASMQPWEILASESQERMLALASPGAVDEVVARCAAHGVDATPIGEVTRDGRLVFTHRGEVVGDSAAASLADEGPVYHRPVADWTHPAAAEDVDAPPASADPGDGGGSSPPTVKWQACVLDVVASAELASAEWVWRQYDTRVGSGTVQGPGGDAAVIRLPADARGRPGGTRGVAVSTDGNGRWCTLDPREGARLLVAEAARNVAVTGAQPVAATNCLNFGSPERPEVMGAFRDVVDGMAEACTALGIPVTGGNVSFYNATGETAVHPTPVIGMLGVLDDVATAVGIGFAEPGDAVMLVGADTRPGLGGSAYLWATEHRIAGRPPRVNLDEEAALHGLLVAAARAGTLHSAHDVSAGGLVTALVESCLASRLGVSVAAEPGLAPRQWLFSESPSRAVVSVAADDRAAFADRCAEHRVGAQHLGVVSRDPRLVVPGLLDLDLDEAARRRDATLPAALNA